MSHSVIHSRGTGLTRTAGSLLNFSLLVTIQSAASVFFFRQHLFACCQASFLPAGPGTRKHAPHYFCSLFSSFLLQGLFFNIPAMSCLFFSFCFFVLSAIQNVSSGRVWAWIKQWGGRQYPPQYVPRVQHLLQRVLRLLRCSTAVLSPSPFPVLPCRGALGSTLIALVSVWTGSVSLWAAMKEKTPN